VRTLHKLLRWFAWDFWLFHGFNISSFVSCFSVVELSLFWQNIKYVLYVKICHEAKLKAFVKLLMIRNQRKTFQHRMICRELNNCTLAELPSKLIRQTLVVTYSLRVESRFTTHLICNSCRPTAVLTGTVNNQAPSTKNGTWWSANITPCMRIEHVW